MSGGSYNYLCIASVEDLALGGHEEDLRCMAKRLDELGYYDAAKETECLGDFIAAGYSRLATATQRLSDIWRAVEWLDSGDWGPEEVEKAAEEYRQKPKANPNTVWVFSADAGGSSDTIAVLRHEPTAEEQWDLLEKYLRERYDGDIEHILNEYNEADFLVCECDIQD